jgi:hypothetical protein
MKHIYIKRFQITKDIGGWFLKSLKAVFIFQADGCRLGDLGTRLTLQ